MSNTRDRILDFIKAYLKREGYSPTLQEICDGVGLAARSAIMYHLDILEDQGYLTRKKGLARTIRLTPDNVLVDSGVEYETEGDDATP